MPVGRGLVGDVLCLPEGEGSTLLYIKVRLDYSHWFWGGGGGVGQILNNYDGLQAKIGG